MKKTKVNQYYQNLNLGIKYLLWIVGIILSIIFGFILTGYPFIWHFDFDLYSIKRLMAAFSIKMLMAALASLLCYWVLIGIIIWLIDKYKIKKIKRVFTNEFESKKRHISAKQWMNLLHIMKAKGEKKEWIDETFKFPGGGKIEVNSGLDLKNCTSLTSLPEGLKVNGHLNLENCTSLTSLPEGLTVNGSSYLINCTSLTSLPEGLKVGGDLYLYGCISLTSLPKGLKVNGNLHLIGCTSLTSLPKGLTVNGSLDLTKCTSLTSLPEGLKVGEDLDLTDCKSLIKNKEKILPKILKLIKEGKVKGLDLEKCDIKNNDAPKNLKIYDELLQSIINIIDNDVVIKFISIFKKYTNNKKNLEFEAKIFGLWLLSLGVPNEKFKDDIHNAYCEKLNFNEAEIKEFYLEISKRYKIYFKYFYDDYQNNRIPPMLPSAIYEIIVNENPNFNPNKFIPIMGDVDNFFINIEISNLMIGFQDILNKMAAKNKNIEKYFTGK